MPIFDFICDRCGYEFEEYIFKPNEKDSTKCPKCNGTSKQTMRGSNVSFRLYGVGFQNRSHRDTGEFAD